MAPAKPLAPFALISSVLLADVSNIKSNKELGYIQTLQTIFNKLKNTAITPLMPGLDHNILLCNSQSIQNSEFGFL